MSTETRELIEIVLRECASKSGEPWSPSEFADATGVPRDRLDPILDELRMGGLIELTPWVSGKGQGYAITEAGVGAVHSPRRMKQLRERGVPTQMDKPAHQDRYDASSTTWDRGEAVRQALVNPGTPRVTRTLLFINIGVFLVGWMMALQQDVGGKYVYGQGNKEVQQIQLKTGMLSKRRVFREDEWWRTVSCFFVHIGGIHIALNMYFLFMIGPMAEGMFGTMRFLILYFFAGLGASFSALMFSSVDMMAGASGALCGILAALPVWVLMNKRFLPPNLVSSWMRNIVINIFLIVFISMLPGISAAGHFGGGIAGAIVAVPLVITRFGKPTQRAMASVGVVALILALGGMFFFLRASGQEVAIARTATTAFHQAIAYMQKSGKGRKYLNMGVKRRDVDKRELKAAREHITDLLEPMHDLAKGSTWTKHGRTTRDAAKAWIALLESLRRGLDPNTQWTKDNEQNLRQAMKNAIEENNKWYSLEDK